MDPAGLIQQALHPRVRISLTSQILHQLVRGKKLNLQWIEGIHNPADQYSRSRLREAQPVPSTKWEAIQRLLHYQRGNPFALLARQSDLSTKPFLVGGLQSQSPGGGGFDRHLGLCEPIRIVNGHLRLFKQAEMLTC